MRKPAQCKPAAKHGSKCSCCEHPNMVEMKQAAWDDLPAVQGRLRDFADFVQFATKSGQFAPEPFSQASDLLPSRSVTHENATKILPRVHVD